MVGGTMNRLVLLAFALFLIPAFVVPLPEPDWPAWVVGAHLSGDAHRLYSLPETERVARTFVAEPRGAGYAFVRPPVYATLLKPLAWMSPENARIAFVLVNVAAISVAAWLLWPSPFSVPVSLLFLPLVANFRSGQDMPFFVLALAVASRLLEKRPVLAGMALSLLGLKFHLLLLLPLYFLVRRAWRMAAGFCAGGAALVASCFALYGAEWPRLYYDLVMLNEMSQPNGYWLPGDARVPVSIALALVLLFLLRRAKDDRTALYVTLTLSVLAAPRALIYDLALAYPLFLVGVKRFAPKPESSSATAPTELDYAKRLA